MKYLVYVKEIHTQIVAIEATSEAEALEKVREGDGEYASSTVCEETLDTDEWTVEEDK